MGDGELPTNGYRFCRKVTTTSTRARLRHCASRNDTRRRPAYRQKVCRSSSHTLIPPKSQFTGNSSSFFVEYTVAARRNRSIWSEKIRNFCDRICWLSSIYDRETLGIQVRIGFWRVVDGRNPEGPVWNRQPSEGLRIHKQATASTRAS